MSNIPRDDRRQAAVSHAGTKGRERAGRRREEWVDEERGRKGKDE